MPTTTVNPNSMYAVKIKKTVHDSPVSSSDGDASGSWTVYAYAPTEFAFDTSASYEPAFGALSSGLFKDGVLNSVMNAMGVKPIFQAWTMQGWSGSSSGEMQLRLEFQAERDAYSDVVWPVYLLLSSCAAGTNKLNLITSPVGGISPKAVLDYINSLGGQNTTNDSISGSFAALPTTIPAAVGNATTYAKNLLSGQNSIPASANPNATTTSTNTPTIGTKEWLVQLQQSTMSIQIGKKIKLPYIVPTSASLNYTSQPDPEGFFSHAVVTFSFRTLFMLTQDDLKTIFGIKPNSGAPTVSGLVPDSTYVVDANSSLVATALQDASTSYDQVSNWFSEL